MDSTRNLVFKLILVALGVFGILFGSDMELLKNSGIEDAITSGVDGVAAAVVTLIVTLIGRYGAKEKAK